MSPASNCFETSNGWLRRWLDLGAGPATVVFLHGIPTNAALWLDVIDALGPSIRSVAPDLTGFGPSDLPTNANLSPSGQAADLLGFLDRRDVDRFTLVAHDYGALVALELLATIPDRIDGVVIANTSIQRQDWSGARYSPFRLLRVPGIGELAFKLARRWMLRLAFRPFVANRKRLTDDLLDAFWEPFEHGFERTLLRLFRMKRIDRDAAMRWQRALLAYDGPVTLVWGLRDPAFRVDRASDIARLASRATVIELDHSSHFVPIDSPRVLARVITRQVMDG